MNAARQDWLAAYDPEFDLPDQTSSSTAKRSGGASAIESPAKKTKTAHQEDSFRSFLRGEVLSKAQVGQLGKTLQAKHGLEKASTTVRQVFIRWMRGHLTRLSRTSLMKLDTIAQCWDRN
jgi:hypothetical protein